MTRGHHRLAPRGSNHRRIALIAAPLVTSGLVAVGVATTGVSTDAIDFSALATSNAADLSHRGTEVSRSAARTSVEVSVEALPTIKRKLWTTADLDLRTGPREKAQVTGEIPALTKVGVTGVRRNGFAQVVYKSRPRWITAAYLVAKKPTDPAHLPIIGKPCPDGSVENGLTNAAITVYRAVCNNFPQITSYGGWDNHGEHSSGRAIDIMISDPSLGDRVAEFLRAHASQLGLFDVIWRQRIFTRERAGEGWRSMPNRGSATANHYDHVHVSVY